MRKFEFVAHYYYVPPLGSAEYAVSTHIATKAWRYKTARRKALEIAQKSVREADTEGLKVAFRLCKW